MPEFLFAYSMTPGKPTTTGHALPEQGPNFIASQMGHANAQMVYRVYGAWMQENNEEQVNLINSKFTGAALHMPYRKTVNA